MSARISDRPADTAAAPPVRTLAARRQALAFGPLIAGALYLAGSLAAVARLPHLAVTVICVILGGGVVIAALITVGTGLSAMFISACGIAGAAWLAYACASTPWSWIMAVALAVPAIAAIMLYPVLREREHRAAEKARLAAEAAALAQQQRKWPDLLARIGHKGVMFAGQEKTRAGYLVHLRLPGSGRVTYSALAPATEQFEVAARLRHGSLRFERGVQAHKVTLHVAERDVLAETVPFPDDQGPLSILRPLPLGLFEDGHVCAVTLREIATLDRRSEGQRQVKLVECSASSAGPVRRTC